MVKNKKELKVGHEVWIIEPNLDINKKKINAVIQEYGEIKYRLGEDSKFKVFSKEDIFLTESKAKVTKKNFLDNLRFNVGDLLIFKYKEYSRECIQIGLVKEITNHDKPYKITTSRLNIYDLTDEDIILKIKNEYIENFENLKELIEKLSEAQKEVNQIISSIHKEHEFLEKELEQSFAKQYAWYSDKKKPKFKDRFEYREDYD